MGNRRIRLYLPQAILHVLLGGALFWLGALFFAHPEVPDHAIAEDRRICVTLLLTSVLLVYSIAWPYSGGISLSVMAVIFAYVFHFHSVYLPLAGTILMLGALAIVQGRRRGKN